MSTSPDSQKMAKDSPGNMFVYLMTDVVGSTSLWLKDALGMDECLSRMDTLFAEISEDNGGFLIGERGEGDSHFFVFRSAVPALKTAAEIGRRIREDPLLDRISLRTAIHAGESNYRSGNYYGIAVNQCARIRAVANPGQILVSQAIKELGNAAPDVGFKSVGKHKLRDLPQPEELYQLLALGLEENFPEIRQSRLLNHNLPAFLTSFVGRETDLLKVTQLCRACRVTTVTGPGGIGKTRLATRVGEQFLKEFEGGIWFVDLTTTNSETGVIAALVGALSELGVKDESGLRSVLNQAPALLIVDNCEQVDRACHDILKGLLSSCPLLKVLSTSRKPLRIPGERSYQLGCLNPTSSETLSDAVQLFLERTKEHHLREELEKHSLRDIEHLCRKLDGLPLAIEIVAGWTDLLSVPEITERIDSFLESELPDDFQKPYSRTVAATIESSCQLLSPGARQLLICLTIFPNGWTLDAAKRICSETENDPSQVERQMVELLGMSLVIPESVVAGKRRFRMFLTTSQVISRHLPRVPRELKQRFVSYYVERSTAAKSLADAGQETLSFSAIESEYESFICALEWSVDDDPSSCLRIAENLSWHWLKSSRILDGRHWFQRLSQVSKFNRIQMASCYSGLASFCIRLDELTKAQEALAHAQECVENAHDYQWARIVGNQGTVWHRLGDMENARLAFEACLTVFHDLGYRSEEGLALINLGVCMMRLDEPHEKCSEVFYRSLRCGEELGSASMQANAYSSLAEVHSLMGQEIDAIGFCKKAIALYQKGVWLVQTAWTFLNLAHLLNKVGAFEESALVWQAARRLELLASTKFSPRQQDILSNLDQSYRQNLSPEQLRQEESRCSDASSDELINLALHSIDRALQSVTPA